MEKNTPFLMTACINSACLQENPVFYKQKTTEQWCYILLLYSETTHEAKCLDQCPILFIVCHTSVKTLHILDPGMTYHHCYTASETKYYSSMVSMNYELLVSSWTVHFKIWNIIHSKAGIKISHMYIKVKLSFCLTN